MCLSRCQCHDALQRHALLQRGAGGLTVQRRGGGLQKRQQLPAIGRAQLFGHWL